MRPCYSLMLVLLLFSVACKQPKDRISKLWFYTFSEPGTKTDTLMSAASFLTLFPDGTYARDFGSFDYGHWSVENGVLSMTGYKGTKTTYPYIENSLNSITLLLKDEEKAVFESMPLPPKQDGPNPFSTELNTWRIPATHKESRQEIRKRLRDHCKFWEAYFSWAFVNNITSLDVRSTPTNIKIYGNGFGLKRVPDLPAQWTRYFYDQEDCAKANEELANILQKESIAWAKTDSKYKMFISAFQQMQQFLR